MTGRRRGFGGGDGEVGEAVGDVLAGVVLSCRRWCGTWRRRRTVWVGVADEAAGVDATGVGALLVGRSAGIAEVQADGSSTPSSATVESRIGRRAWNRPPAATMRTRYPGRYSSRAGLLRPRELPVGLH
jgi:hypothetical protein